ncbi:MAG TPA: MATE family efflux transporter [Actinomycetota bacterium]|nr:MATE family efflux transporter [Actinomycetota bacterium]
MGTSSNERPSAPGFGGSARRKGRGSDERGELPSRAPRGRGFRAALESAFPAARFGDQRTILAGTSQSAAGLVVAILATFATQVLITRVQGPAAFGVVTMATQGALVLGFFSRFGMDMAAVRRVAIDLGQGERARVRALVSRASVIAAAASLVVAGLLFAFAEPLARAFAPDLAADATEAFRAAALAVPFAALVQVYLGATRGLKIMRHTLYVFWMGQPLAWMALILIGWLAARSVGVTTLAYSVSWIVATLAAAWLWLRETRGFGRERPLPGEVGDLLRYGAPRAPAALFSQLLFWTDLFVLARFASSVETGVYAAAARSAQVILLFTISVSLMFAPFVADLHARGERDKLDRLFKQVTRWTLAATLPIFVVLAAAPEAALRLFGSDFGAGQTALLILLVGQLINVATGTVGFVLIMVGRTGWDLVVYAASVAFDIGSAILLIGGLGLGMEGAALAGALTMALSKLARLFLVWRFVGIQPYDRDYARLLFPTLAGVAGGVAAHLALSSGPWQLDLLGTAAAAWAGYVPVLLVVGLPGGERRAALHLASAALGRRGESRG